MVRQAGVAPGAASRDVENAAWTAFGMPRSDLTAQRSCVSVFQNRQDLAGSDIPKVDSCVCVLQEYIVLRVSAPLAEHFLVVIRKLLRHIGLLKVPPGASARRAVFPAASLARTVRVVPMEPQAGVAPAARNGGNGHLLSCGILPCGISPGQRHREPPTVPRSRFLRAAAYILGKGEPCANAQGGERGGIRTRFLRPC